MLRFVRQTCINMNTQPISVTLTMTHERTFTLMMSWLDWKRHNTINNENSKRSYNSHSKQQNTCHFGLSCELTNGPRLYDRCAQPPCVYARTSCSPMHVKDPVVHVRVWWITQKDPACTSLTGGYFMYFWTVNGNSKLMIYTLSSTHWQ